MRFIDAPVYIRQLTAILYILTFVLSIIGLFVAVRMCKKRSFVIQAAITFALSFISVFLTMRGSYRYRVGLSVFEPSLTVLELPLWLHCSVAALLLFGTISGLIRAVLWNRKHLSPVSIKESADKLPAGVCFYEQSGLVRLINTEMDRLCVIATGKALLNGASFWQKISQGQTEENCVSLKTGDEPIIKFKDGKVVSFGRYAHDVYGKTVYEIVAADITEQYLLTKELENKLVGLKQINKRLIDYGNNVVELTKEKELLAAKIRIHDDMGKLLLATKRKLAENLTEKDKKELLDFWQVEITAMKSERRNIRKNNLQVIEDAAKLVGVTVDFFGEQPEENTADEKILISAMHECLTNTVSHANGKKMTVAASCSGGCYRIIITNDGEKPKGEIKEGGGLSGLRMLVERENGVMTVKRKPQFQLEIELPQVNREINE